MQNRCVKLRRGQYVTDLFCFGTVLSELTYLSAFGMNVETQRQASINRKHFLANNANQIFRVPGHLHTLRTLNKPLNKQIEK